MPESDTSIRINPIYPIKGGTVTVTAETQDGSQLSAECKVTVLGEANSVRVNFLDTDIESQRLEKGEKAVKPDDPKKEGYKFLGWSTDPGGQSGYFDFENTVVNNSIDLYPIWQDMMLHVTFDTFGGSFVEMQRVDNNGTATKPDDPTWKDHTFLGWTTDEENAGVIRDDATWSKFDFSTKITQDTTLYAVWTSDVRRVTFCLPSGRYITDKVVKKNTVLTDIPVITRDGYTFLGWSTGRGDENQIVDFTKPITESMNVYPIWRSNTVTIVLHMLCPETDPEDSAYKTETVNRNDVFKEPATPTKKGYSFVKWYVPYTDKNEKYAEYIYDFTKSVGDNINTIKALQNSTYYFNGDDLSLFAEMSANPVTVTYHMNGVGGKDVLTTKTTKYNTNVDTDIYPSVPGYAFLGWYTDKECTTKSVDWDKVDDHIDLYAGWLKFADYSNETSTKTIINKIYNVTIATADSDHGTTNVTEGRGRGTASITARPAAGYEIDKIRVTGEDGKEIPVKKTGNHTYSFDIPERNAAVIATYKAKDMPFTDVPGGAYYFRPVEWANKNGITQGTSATAFSPNRPCRRSEMVMFLWRMAGSPEVSGKIPFKDIPNNAYYRDALLWAIQNHITSGTTNATFSPNDPCSRGQMAMFLWRMRGKPAASGFAFDDVRNTDYFKDAVLWLKNSGITAGKSQTLFDPSGDCTRGQMVTFLYRYAGNK